MLISKFPTEGISQEIEAFEKEYKITIPAEYRGFLLKYNGGLTPQTNFRVNRVSSDIEGFYGFGAVNVHYHYNKFREMDMLSDYLEEDMLPIADNSFGDDIVLGIGKANAGQIFFRYHDRETKYIKLADSFAEFTGKCKSKKIGHIRTIEERRQDMRANGMKEKMINRFIDSWQEEIDHFKDIHQEKLVLDES